MIPLSHHSMKACPSTVMTRAETRIRTTLLALKLFITFLSNNFKSCTQHALLRACLPTAEFVCLPIICRVTPVYQGLTVLEKKKGSSELCTELTMASSLLSEMTQKP